MAPNACSTVIISLAFLTETAALLWKIYQLILDLCAISAKGLCTD